MNGKESAHPLKASSSQASDIENLQRSIRSLADAMHEELRTVRAENHRLKTDRETWLMSMRALKEECSDKIVHMELEKTRVVAELSSIKTGIKEDVARLLLATEEKQRVLERQVNDLRVEVRSLKTTVEDARVLGSTDFPNSVIDQRLRDKEAVLAMMADAVREVAPLAIFGAVRSEAPAFVKECVGEEMRIAVEAKGEDMRREVIQGEERLRQLLSKTTIEVAETTGEIQALQERCRGLETSSLSQEARLRGLEDLEAQHPRAIASGLSERFEIMVQKQARYARSMEEVVRALVEDASTIQGQVQAQGASLESHQTYASETRQALLRSVAVFSQVLNIPVPIPLKSLSKEPRKGFHPSSSSSISSHPTPSHETTSKSSPPPHFPVNSQGPVPPSPYPSHPHPHPHSPHLSSAHATAAAAAGGGFLEERSPFDRLIPQRGISERSMMAYDDNNKVSGEDWIKELENEALKSSGLCKPY